MAGGVSGGDVVLMEGACVLGLGLALELRLELEGGEASVGEAGFGWGGVPPVGKLGEWAAVSGTRSGVPSVGDEESCFGFVGSRRPPSMSESW